MRIHRRAARPPIGAGNDTAFRASRVRSGGRIGDHPPLPFDPMPRHALRIALMVVLACIACAAGAAAVDDRYAADPKLRRFVDSMHGETAAVHLGRIVYRKRWEELLTEALYQVAPRGVWSPAHLAWPAARSALAEALRRQSVTWLAANRDEIRLVVNEQSVRAYTEDERARVTEFFESPGGRI